MNLEQLKPVLDYAAPLLNIILEPLIATLIVAMILGLATGGHLRYLGQLASLRRWELVLAAFAVQYYLARYAPTQLPRVEIVGPLLYVASYILLLVMIGMNRRQVGIVILGVGIGMNFLVIVANGGHMPVSTEAAVRAGLNDLVPLLRDPTYVLHTTMNAGTRLSFLADTIVLPPPYPRPKVLSPGDIVMAGGVFVLILRWMHKRPRQRIPGAVNLRPL